MAGQRDTTWIPQHHVDRLTMHQIVESDNQPDNTITLSQRLLTKNVPYIVLELLDLALNDPDSRVRLSACQQILDRTLGKAGVLSSTDTAPLDTLQDKLIAQVEAMLQQAATAQGN